jgi:STE24 endopeptidase
MRLIIFCFLFFWVHSFTFAEDVSHTFGTTNGVAHHYVQVPKPTPQAIAYYKSGSVVWAAGIVWSVAVPALLLFTGFASWLRNFSHKPGRRLFLANAIFFAALTTIFFLIALPLDFFAGFVRPHHFGLSNQTLADWWGDWAKMLFVSVVGVVSLAWVPFWIVRKSPRRWWLICGIGAVPLAIIFLLVEPLWIAPLFDKFGPMRDKVLEQKILTLASRANIEDSRVFEVNKSEETKAVNAYVTGFLNSKRIVLWDTAITKLEEDELLDVLGHEMGHFVLGHMTQVIVGASIAILAGLFFIHQTGGKLVRRFKNRFGFESISDVAAAPLFILLFQVALFALTPIAMAVSRHNEYEADRFALELTRNNRAAATAFAKLQQENLSVPYHGIIHKLWRGSHPDLGDRITFCNEYRPWETNGPSKYEKFFGK